MADIAPELAEAVAKKFESRARANKQLSRIAGMIRDGTATMTDAHDYAQNVGEVLADVFQELVGEGVLPNDVMYYNIANRVVKPAIKNNYDIITEAAKLIQQHMDEKAGLGIETVAAPFPEERIAGLIDKITDAEDLEEVRRWLKEPVVNNSEAFVDDFVRENARVRSGMGLGTYIVRKSAPGCCSWCAAMAGRFPYGEEPQDVYRRHEFCRCVVTAEYEKGGRQDVWSKREWTASPEDLEYRKTAGRQERLTPQERTSAADRLERDREISEYQRETGYSRRTSAESTRGKTPKQIAEEIRRIRARQRLIAR